MACASLGPKEETSARRGRRGSRPRPTGISGCSVLVGVAQRPVAHRAQRSAQQRVSPRLHLLLEPPSAATSFHIRLLGPAGALSHPL
jgi:hypothetical protein